MCPHVFKLLFILVLIYTFIYSCIYSCIYWYLSHFKSSILRCSMAAHFGIIAQQWHHTWHLSTPPGHITLKTAMLSITQYWGAAAGVHCNKTDAQFIQQNVLLAHYSCKCYKLQLCSRYRPLHCKVLQRRAGTVYQDNDLPIKIAFFLCPLSLTA